MELQKSKHFKKILEVSSIYYHELTSMCTHAHQMVLAIGNHMNMGNVRIGQAQGFRIGFLSQLRGLRTTDGKSSLLHFLTGLAERKFPQSLDFPEELSTCTLAARGRHPVRGVCVVSSHTCVAQSQGRLWRWRWMSCLKACR